MQEVFKVTFHDGCWLKVRAVDSFACAEHCQTEYGQFATIEKLPATDAAVIAANGRNRLAGPQGLTSTHERIALHSVFQRDSFRQVWQWIARDAQTGRVWHVIEFPFRLEGCYDTEHGALWALRECAASHFHAVRSHRGH